MLIIASKNFKSGDYIELEDGAAGSIDSVDLIYTTINSSDNKRIVIPNSVLAGNIVTNYSHNELRRVDMNFSIGYNDSIAKAREIISGLIDEAPGSAKGSRSPCGGAFAGCKRNKADSAHLVQERRLLECLFLYE